MRVNSAACVIVAGAGLSFLSGCAQPAGAPPGPSMAAPAAATAPMSGPVTGMDGTYAGGANNAQTKTGRAQCLYTGQLHVRVRGGTATSYWRGPMQGTVGPDGTVSITGNGATIAGRISGGTLTGTLDTTACGYTLNLTRS